MSKGKGAGRGRDGDDKERPDRQGSGENASRSNAPWFDMENEPKRPHAGGRGQQLNAESVTILKRPEHGNERNTSDLSYAGNSPQTPSGGLASASASSPSVGERSTIRQRRH